MENYAQPLLTDRLTLRLYEEGDAPEMYEAYCHDPEVTKFLTWDPHASVEVTEAFLKSKLQEEKIPGHYDWFICLEGKIIGSIGVVNRYEEGGVEVGYCLGKAFWGKGYMSEAFHAVLTFLFFRAGFAYALMKADVHNARSRRVIEKQGFLYDHEEEEDLPLKNSRATLAVYMLNKADFVK
jgi:ribosomal-protein-alanine N-acetyltransferase